MKNSIKNKLKKGLVGLLLVGSLTMPLKAEDQEESALDFLGQFGAYMMSTGAGDELYDTPEQKKAAREFGTFMKGYYAQEQENKLAKERNKAIKESGSNVNVNIINNDKKSTKKYDDNNNKKTIPLIFACNYVKDFNEDGSLKYPDEFIGIKNKFRKGEGLVLNISSNNPEHLGKEFNYKFFNQKGESFLTNTCTTNRLSYFHIGEKDDLVKYFLDLNGPGIYTMSLHIDSKFEGLYTFEIMDNEDKKQNEK